MTITGALRRNKNANKTRIDWDLNVFCPEQWYGEESTWDTDLWKINARIYMDNEEVTYIDTDYNITLLEKEARELGLIAFGQKAEMDPEYIFDDWLDASLDGFISLNYFKKMYWEDCSDRLKEFLDDLPVYLQDVPDRMKY